MSNTPGAGGEMTASERLARADVLSTAEMKATIYFGGLVPEYATRPQCSSLFFWLTADFNSVEEVIEWLERPRNVTRVTSFIIVGKPVRKRK